MTVSEQFKCPYCGFETKSPSLFAMHMLTVHNRDVILVGRKERGGNV